MNIRPDWRSDYGPLSLVMPHDPPPTTASFANPVSFPVFHEDSEDRLNADGTWGSDPWGYGGSGIVMGYACDDIEAVLAAEQGCWVRKVKYDYSHWVRQIRYSIAAWEMTHDAKFARRIAAYDNIACGQFTDDPQTIHLHDPGWIPFTLAQYHAMAIEDVGGGLPADYIRAMAWIGYGKAMRLKIDRKALHGWGEMWLETCELAAAQGTGQIAKGFTSTFHEAFVIHAALALYHRLKRPVAPWVFDLMRTIQSLPTIDYPDSNGLPSPARFWRTEAGVAVAEAPPGQEQQGDPGFAYWSANCIALWRVTGDANWKRRASLFGPTEAKDENSRQLSMVLRGAKS